ncbi:MAG: Ig-like domain-containing protein [Eggerthellaceae bacterium]|nr:Ig-like domain-containing protein [Eggerthellaceae bacterium]
MRALQRIASTCICLPLAVALVPAAAFAAPLEAATPAESALGTQAGEHGHVHVWEWEQQEGSSYVLEGFCPVCDQSITNVVTVNVSGLRKTSELSALVQNSVAKFKEDNQGTGLDDIQPVVSLKLTGNTVITIDDDLSIAEISQSDRYVESAFSLTVRGDSEHVFSVTDGGTWIGGDFTIESGKFTTSASAGSALYAAGSMTLAGGELTAKGNLRGIFSGGDITVKDPARIVASSGYSRNSAAAVYCGGAMHIEGGNIISASGLHGIYSKGDIVITGGDVNASVNASEYPEPALYSSGAITIDLEKVKIETPEDGNLGLSHSSWTSSTQDGSAVSAVLKDNAAAQVVKIADGVTRDAAFYENFGKQSGTDAETGAGESPESGTGADSGAGTSGKTDGTSVDNPTGSDAGKAADGTNAGSDTGSSTDGTKTGTDTGSSADETPDAKTAAEIAASTTGEGNVSGAVYRILKLKAKTSTESTIKLTWKAPANASKYIVFGTKCGVDKRYQLIDTVTGSSYTDSGLKKNTYYRYFIVAFDANGKLISKSMTVHLPTAGGKFSNIKSVNVSHAKAALAVGEKLNLSASVQKTDFSAQLKVHLGMRYESSNKKVATVNKSGRIAAKGAGTCVIYSIAQNGVCAKTKVTVS